MTETSRKDFELWYKKSGMLPGIVTGCFGKKPDGTYAYLIMESRWQIWKAATKSSLSLLEQPDEEMVNEAAEAIHANVMTYLLDSEANNAALAVLRAIASKITSSNAIAQRRREEG